MGREAQKGLARNGVDERASCVWSLDSPVSRCIQIVFLPPPPKDNFRSIFDFHSTMRRSSEK